MDKRLQIMINLSISVLIFALIFYLVGADKIISVFSKARFEFLILAVLSYICVNIVMSYRLGIILESLGEKLSMRDVLPSSLAGMFASDFTPARSGYFFTAFSLSSKFHIALDKTVITIFGPQIFDFLIKAASAAVLVFLVMNIAGMDNILLSTLVLVVIFAGIITTGLLVFYPPLLARFSLFERLPLVPRIFAFLTRMHEHSEKVLSIKWGVIGLSLLSWTLKGLEWLFLAKAIGLPLSGDFIPDLLFMMVFQGAITIIQFLPIPTLAGAGASEAGFAAVLLPFGVPVESGIVFGFLTRIAMIFVDMFSLPVILGYLHTHSLEKSLENLQDLGH